MHRFNLSSRLTALLISLLATLSLHAGSRNSEPAFLKSEIVFPLETWHNHASCIVEAPNGDLLLCWFHGSGERNADDVKIEGARKRKGARNWSPRFTMADTLGYPDTNCAMFIDPQNRLWLLWPTILANRWESALMKYRVSTDYRRDGPPRWDADHILHLTPGPQFSQAMSNYVQHARARPLAFVPEELRDRVDAYFQTLLTRAGDKLSCRLGWMTRAHPFILDGKRLIVPLYSDGFDCSMMAITDDWGQTWHTSAPLVGSGNIQPSIVRRKDGSLFTLMRDNGPPPKRLMQSDSHDHGETWSDVIDSQIPNPGSGAEIIGLRNGHWVLISNDTEEGRFRLTVQISHDEGRTWKWKRQLESTEPGAGSFHYPSIIQARDGSLHASYSYHLSGKNLPKDVDGDPAGKSIKHAHFNEAWVMEGNPKDTKQENTEKTER
jgi:hypothetical protein